MSTENEETPDIEGGVHKVLDRDDSVLDRHTDPFAPREGKTLTWKNVNMTLVSIYKRAD